MCFFRLSTGSSGSEALNTTPIDSCNHAEEKNKIISPDPAHVTEMHRQEDRAHGKAPCLSTNVPLDYSHRDTNCMAGPWGEVIFLALTAQLWMCEQVWPIPAGIFPGGLCDCSEWEPEPSHSGVVIWCWGSEESQNHRKFWVGRVQLLTTRAIPTGCPRHRSCSHFGGSFPSSQHTAGISPALQQAGPSMPAPEASRQPTLVCKEPFWALGPAFSQAWNQQPMWPTQLALPSQPAHGWFFCLGMMPDQESCSKKKKGSHDFTLCMYKCLDVP